MTPEQLKKSLAKGQAAPVYFFSGPEAGLMKEALDAVAALVPAAARDFNVQVFHAFEADFAEVVTAARTLPFLAQRRVVVLRDVEKARLDQMGRAELLAEYLAAPVPETVFVVTTADEAKARSLAKQHAGRWVHVEFGALRGEALARALRAEAERAGLRLTAAGLGALLEATGADLGIASNELAKLRAALGEGGAVDEEAVGRYVAGYARHESFDIVDAVARRDLAAALRVLGETTLRDEDFLGLLGMLGKRLRILWYLAGGERDLPREFRAYPGQVEKWRSDARRFTRAEIERGFAGLQALDDRVKSTQVPPRLLLEHFLIGFLSGGGPDLPGARGET